MEIFMLIMGALVVIASLVILGSMTRAYNNEINFKKFCRSFKSDTDKTIEFLNETIRKMKKRYKLAVMFLMSAAVFGIVTFAMNFIIIFTNESYSELVMFLNLIQVLSLMSTVVFITIINYKRIKFE
jgi:hypothetical protein